MKMLRLNKNDKTPLVAGSFDGENESLINSWIDEGGNIGLLTGSKSNIAVIDVDMHNNVDGITNLRNFLEKYEITLPRTRVIKTPNGGYHYYFNFPEELHNKRFIQQHSQLKGVDFQTNGRYVVAPPSKINGNSYTVVRDVSLANLPEKWLSMYEDDCMIEHNTPRKRKWTADFLGDILQGCDSGGRNIWMTSQIGKLFATGLEDNEILTWSKYINQIGCHPPIDEKELLTIYNSVRKIELRKKEKD